MSQVAGTFRVAWEIVYRSPAIVKSKIIGLQLCQIEDVLCSSLKIKFLFRFLSHDKLLNLTSSHKDSDTCYIIRRPAWNGSAGLILNPDLPWPFPRQTEWDLGRGIARGRSKSTCSIRSSLPAQSVLSFSWVVARRAASAKRDWLRSAR